MSTGAKPGGVGVAQAAKVPAAGAEPSQNMFIVAAQQLMHALAQSQDEEYRLALLKRIVRRLGPTGYPRFLKLLLTVAQSRDERAKKALADVFAYALRKMDLPGGEMTSWGASSMGADGETMSASALSGVFFSGAPKRAFGPIEYLSAWFGQSTQRRRLSAQSYQDALQALLTLFSYSPQAAALYQQKLEADAKTEMEGAYTRQTRERMRAIAQSWRDGLPPSAIAAQAAAQ
jgi:hypothetical protein